METSSTEDPPEVELAEESPPLDVDDEVPTADALDWDPDSDVEFVTTLVNAADLEMASSMEGSQGHW